jgi:ATP-dependent Clp protease ATP-binding subunit ClpA
LTHSHLCQILDLELNKLQDTVFENKGEKSYMFAVSEDARQEILQRGTDAKYGARYLKRALKRYLIDPLAQLVCAGQVKAGDMVLLDFKNGAFDMFVELEKLTPLQMGWAQNLIYAKGILVPTMRHFKVLEEPAA